MTVCVGSTDEWREAGKIGLRAQRLAYISHTPSPHDYTIQTFFFTTQWAVFFPVCSVNYVNDEGIPFFSPVAKRRKDWSERNASSFFFAPSSLCLWTFHVDSVGPGFQLCGHVKGWWWLLEPGEGEGQRTMTYTKSWGGSQEKNAGLVVGRLDID